MKLPNITTGQAQILIGIVGLGIGLYAIYQTKDTIDKASQATKDAFNPTKDTNLAYKATSGLLGEGFVIDKIGGGIASVVDWWNKPKEPPKKAVQATHTNTTGVLKPVVLPKEVKKLVAPVMKSNDFRFYELKPK